MQASLEIVYFLNQKVHHRVHKTLQLDPILEPAEFSPHLLFLFPNDPF
jgi:hypothetical protein